MNTSHLPNSDLDPLDDAHFEELLQIQSSDWIAGQQRSLESFSELARDKYSASLSVDQWLSLICNETALRASRGQSPSIADYQQRFPWLANELYIQWEINELLTSQTTRHESNESESTSDSTIANQRYPDLGLQRKAWHSDRYELRSELGRGTTGIVYEAWDRLLRRRIALKRLRSGLDASSEELTRIRKEAQAVAQINHAHIVQIYDVSENDENPFFAMEFCEGSSLAKRLNGNPIPPKQAAEIAIQIAQGLAAAHASRIIHRDLKPANILLKGNDSWCVKISDFGLAKSLEGDSNATATGSIIGTPAYMPPEQAFGDAKHVGPAADIYSLGAILYECLTGRPPFRGVTIADTLNQVRNHEPVAIRQLDPKVPIDLETIACKCLNKDPSKRYSSATHASDDLQRFLSQQPILARREQWYEMAIRIGKKNPVASSLALASVGLLLLITVGSLLFAQRLNSEKRNAIRAQQESNRQRDAAMRARNVTREALDAMTSSLAMSSLEQQASVSPEQRKFLQEVLKYYTEFADDKNLNIEFADFAASAAERVAWIHNRLGDRSSARNAHKRPLRNYENSHNVSHRIQTTENDLLYYSIASALACPISVNDSFHKRHSLAVCRRSRNT